MNTVYTERDFVSWLCLCLYIILHGRNFWIPNQEPSIPLVSKLNRHTFNQYHIHWNLVIQSRWSQISCWLTGVSKGQCYQHWGSIVSWLGLVVSFFTGDPLWVPGYILLWLTPCRRPCRRPCRQSVCTLTCIPYSPTPDMGPCSNVSTAMLDPANKIKVDPWTGFSIKRVIEAPRLDVNIHVFSQNCFKI